MITRITIKSEPADRSSKDRLTVTRSSVRYEYEPSTVRSGRGTGTSAGTTAGARAWTGGQGKKWTVSSRTEAFETMFRNLCAEVADIMSLPDSDPRMTAASDGSLPYTTFIVMYDDGKKEERTLTVPDETYTVCFTIIDQMVRSATPDRSMP